MISIDAKQYHALIEAQAQLDAVGDVIPADVVPEHIEGKHLDVQTRVLALVHIASGKRPGQ